MYLDVCWLLLRPLQVLGNCRGRFYETASLPGSIGLYQNIKEEASPAFLPRRHRCEPVAPCHAGS